MKADTWAMKAYDVLKDRGRITTRELVAALKCDDSTACSALRELRKRGCAIRHDSRNAFLVYHTFIKGSARPENLKGLVGDRLVTARKALAEKMRMRAMLREELKAGRENAKPVAPRPIATTALEQAWGWMPRAVALPVEADD